jgi:cAMP-specific phosphodiesterase 4/calcium/calmodulin-dependent 3',5'-cyclic nucleotide phosphodiesterase
MLSDGHTYERRHIQAWLSENNTSPVSGSQLETKVIFTNHAMRNAIEEYFEEVFGDHRQTICRSVNVRGNPQDSRKQQFSRDVMSSIDSLMQCSILVNGDLSIESVLKRIMEEAKSLVGAEVASVFLMDHENQQLYSNVNSTGGELRIPISSGVAGQVAISGSPLIIRDAYHDSRFNTAVDLKTGFKTRNIMCVPIQSWKWGTIGVAQLINKTSGGLLPIASRPSSLSCGHDAPAEPHFTEDDRHFFGVLASQAAIAIVNSGLFESPRKSKRPSAMQGVMRQCAKQIPCPARSKSCNGSSKDAMRSVHSDSIGSSLSSSDIETPMEEQTSNQTSSDEVEAAKMKEVKQVLLQPHPPKAPLKEKSRSDGRRYSSEVARAHPEFERAKNSPTPTSDANDQELSLTGRALIKPVLDQAFRGWETDVLALAEFTANRPLRTLAMYLFDELGLVSFFDLDRAKLKAFLTEIERGYSDNVSYHNSAHAASVLHFTYALLSHGGAAEAVASISFSAAVEDVERRRQLMFLTCLFAAAVHDFEHHGVNNDFLVKTSDPRALHHNDRSPNENHHVAAAFDLLRRPDCNFLECLSAAEYREFRSLAIEMVLGTDMAENGKLLNRFKDVVSNAAADDSSFRARSADEAKLTLQIMLKCADLGHLALSWNSHVKWVRRLEQEFFAQGDMEKKSKLTETVSFLMDRDKPGVTQSQVGFFDFVALPLFQTLVSACPSASPMLDAVSANYRRWQEVEAAVREGGSE